MDIQRRTVVFAAGGLIAHGPVAFAQQPERVARIGWLGLSHGTDPASASIPLAGLRAGLRERGWVEGRNLVIEARYGGFDNAKDLTAELLQAKVDLIVAEGGMVFRARPFVGATPLLFHVNGDPVQAKLVDSYARPGGTMTGVTNLSAELSGKRVELLKTALPRMTRCAAIANQGHPGWQVESDATRDAAGRLKLELTWLPV
jgi:putative ABC transport system substrate-binding protein